MGNVTNNKGKNSSMRMNNTVTIGIPAFNEEANIAHLLNDLLKSEQSGFALKEIVVSSDGSTDKTDEIVKKISKANKTVKLIINKSNRGQAVCQNQIISRCQSNVLVLINADMKIEDKNYISKIVKPIFLKKADLVSTALQPLKPATFFESIIYKSVDIKEEIYAKYNGGKNVYTCHGAARAFSKN